MSVLIVYASAGEGHRKAAEAIYKVLSKSKDCKAISVIDILDYTNRLFKWAYSNIYLLLVNYLNPLWKFLYYSLDSPKVFRLIFKIRHLFNEFISKRFISYLSQIEPKTVISTHFFPSEVAAGLKETGRARFKLLSVVTDFRAHSFWIAKGVDRFIVAFEETKQDILRWGISEDKLSVLGIPVDPIFSKRSDRVASCQRLSLKKDLFNILVVSGGHGVGPMQKLIDSLKSVGEEFPERIQLMVICGHNRRLYRRLKKTEYNLNSSIKFYGFVENMDEFMGLGDLLITKSGGLTISEALVKGLPMIILSPIPGQEYRNAQILVKYGGAVKVDRVWQLKETVKGFIQHPQELTKMRENILRIAKPDAAQRIAEYILILAFLKDRSTDNHR